MQIDQDQIDLTLLNMTIDLSGLTFDGGEIRSVQLSQDERDLVLAALNTLMSQRRQQAVSNRYWANHPTEPGQNSQGPSVALPEG